MASALHVTGHPWDRAAEGWNKHSAVIRSWLEEATGAMLDAARIKPGACVLDIAAGAGDQTLDIARRVGPQGQVLATDISAQILMLARDKARAAGLHMSTPALPMRRHSGSKVLISTPP